MKRHSAFYVAINLLYIFLIVIVLLFVAKESRAANDPAQAQKDPNKLSVVDQQMVTMTDIVKRLEKEIKEAEKEANIIRINCLTIKLNLVKGLIKASKRAEMVIVTAKKEDQKIISLYMAKIQSYFDYAQKVENSLPECSTDKKVEDGATLVYLKPEGEDEIQIFETSPWNWNYTPGVEGYPAVPAASPFR